MNYEQSLGLQSAVRMRTLAEKNGVFIPLSKNSACTKGLEKSPICTLNNPQKDLQQHILLRHPLRKVPVLLLRVRRKSLSRLERLDPSVLASALNEINDIDMDCGFEELISDLVSHVLSPALLFPHLSNSHSCI